MSCRSSLSFMALTPVGTPVGTLAERHHRHDRRDRFRGALLAAGYDGYARLVGLGRFEGAELGAEQPLGKEVTGPRGHPPVRLVAIHAQEYHPHLGTPAEQFLAVGALERRTGHHRRFTRRDALVH